MAPILVRNITGHVDGLIDGALCGWAWAGRRDSNRLSVVFYDGKEPIGETVADTFREDLLRAGIGDGLHAFRWTLPDYLFDGTDHQLRIVCKLTGKDMPGSPLVCMLHEKPALAESALKLEQWLDRLEGLSFESVAARIGRRDAVAYLYIIIMGREPDGAGMDAYLDQLDSLEIGFLDVAAALLASQEFRERLNRMLRKPEDIIRIFEERTSLYS